MSRPKRMIDPVHLSTVIERKTYQGLIAMTNSQALEDERLVSLAEYVRNLLTDAVTCGSRSVPTPGTKSDSERGAE